MVHTCIVRGCKSEWSPGCELKFHAFPSSIPQRNDWLARVPIKSKLYNCAKICSLHFKLDDYEYSGRKLKQSATPYFNENDQPTLPLDEITGQKNKKSLLKSLLETPNESASQGQPCCLVESYRQSGLERLGTKSKIVACPKHFNTEDFHEMLEKCRKNEKDVDVPVVKEDTDIGINDDDFDDDDDQSHQDFEILDEIKVCRVCLALDVKMYDMKDYNLGEMFQNVTGIAAAANNHSIFERVCWECAARLKAAATYRDKALLSNSLLQDLVKTRNHIQKNDITSIKDKHSNLKSSLCIQKVFFTKNVNENKPNEPLKTKDIIKTCTIVRKDLKELEISILKKLKKNNEMEVEESEPLIDDPIKTEIAIIDPLYINNKIDDTLALEITPLDINDRQDKKSEETHIEDCEDKITKHELRIQNYDTIFSAGHKNNNKMNELAIINDNGHMYLKEDKVKTKNVKDNKIDSFGKRISSNKNVVGKMPARKKVASKTGVKKKIATKTGVKKKTTKDNTSRLDEKTKQEIISLKQAGVCVADISKRLGVTPTSDKISSGDSQRKTTAGKNQGLKKNVKDEQTRHTPAVPASQKTTWEPLPYS